MLATAVAFIGLLALGTWQVERRTWKLALIERVDRRVQAPAVPLPAPATWATIDAANDEYRHVQATGSYAPGADTFVQAVTDRGAGVWVLTPLRLADGHAVLVNRGFVPGDARARVASIPGTVTVTGLLRITEPGGGFLRRNEVANERWYSRDVQAIAAARGISQVAPFFVDAEIDKAVEKAADRASDNLAHNAVDVSGDAASRGTPRVVPIAGLTVVAFHNSHLVYAITWYTLASMVAAAAWRLMREERRGEHD